MGNSNKRNIEYEKPVTSQEMVSRIEGNVLHRCENGFYTARFPLSRSSDVNNTIIAFFKSEGFAVTVGIERLLMKPSNFLEDPEEVPIKVIRLSWREATTGKAKICREKSDGTWASKTRELKWNVLKGEEGENASTSDTPLASAPPPEIEGK